MDKNFRLKRIIRDYHFTTADLIDLLGLEGQPFNAKLDWGSKEWEIRTEEELIQKKHKNRK